VTRINNQSFPKFACFVTCLFEFDSLSLTGALTSSRKMLGTSRQPFSYWILSSLHCSYYLEEGFFRRCCKKFGMLAKLRFRLSEDWHGV
jgi:hypothetical protein